MTFILIALAVYVVASLVWATKLLITGRTNRKPPRHVEKSWSVNGLPTRPYVANGV